MLVTSHPRILLLSASRLLFVPLFLGCNLSTSSSGAIFHSDLIYFLFLIAFGITNGYVPTHRFSFDCSTSRLSRLRRQADRFQIHWLAEHHRFVNAGSQPGVGGGRKGRGGHFRCFLPNGRSDNRQHGQFRRQSCCPHVSEWHIPWTFVVQYASIPSYLLYRPPYLPST